MQDSVEDFKAKYVKRGRAGPHPGSSPAAWDLRNPQLGESSSKPTLIFKRSRFSQAEAKEPLVALISDRSRFQALLGTERFRKKMDQ